MRIRTAELSDCKAIAIMHRINLDKSFLGSLGTGFLKILYQAINNHQGGFLIVAVENNELAGFVSGVDDVKSFYKLFLYKKWLAAIFAIIPKLFSLNIIKKVIETFSYGGHDSEISLPKAELLSIAVNEKYRGQGISTQLFEELANNFKLKGIKEFKIIVGSDLLPARKFYSKIGCVERASTQIHQGQESIILAYSIQPNQVVL